ncbi:hypothetical protein CJ030_MR7G016793 [Morella rubra]|uniref:Protein kinase domain-containing protein n=1 Tax=Morella rubra TaxID=262757 RepID=A0A6A1UXQ8_9ROSI|nr:hypothetical protein CJ030_MR7G016793 [Morella rubra]
MEIPYFFLFLVFIIIVQGEAQNGSFVSPCGGHGPGFDLSCTDTKDLVLELPNSVKLYVKKIDYKAQVIHLYDPHHHSLPCQLLGLDLSSSPFKFKEEYYLEEFTLFNCSQTERYDYRQISCLSAPSGHQVYAIESNTPIIELPVSPCTKMYNTQSIPYRIIFGRDDVLQLKWSRPLCGDQCEAKGKICGFKNNNTESEITCFPKHPKGRKKSAIEIGTILGSPVLVLACFLLYRAYRHDKVEKETEAKIEKFLEDYRSFKPARFSYADIKRITNQFSDKLGEGSYGTVFKGKLSSEIFVAVKILNTTSKGDGEEFINEVGTIGRIHHVNVVRLVGFCADGFRRALIYEFLPNDSLDKFISSADFKNRFLGWTRLHDIALGIAKGIDYLHQGCDQRILHFDIKPRNVLLDEDFNPKIADFGLAKLCSKDQSIVSMTTARGTMGYIAPEVFSRNFGNVSYKADVYSFGMLLLELVGGKKNDDFKDEETNQVYFPEWIYNLLEQKEDLRVFIEDDGDVRIAEKLAIVGLWCIQWHPMDRPSMKLVLQMLEGERDKLTMPPNPFASTGPVRSNANLHGRRSNQELEIIPEEL